MLFVQFPRQDVSTFYNRANICQNSSFINHHRAALRNPLNAIPFPFLGPIPLPRNSFLGVTTIFSIGAIAVVNFLPKKKGNPNNLILPYYYFHLIVPKIFRDPPRVLLGEKKKKKREKTSFPPSSSSRCHLHPKKDPWNEAQWLKSDSNRHVGGTSLLPIAHWSSPALGCQRIERAFPVEFFHHSIIPVAREGGDSPSNRPIKGYREISVGGATVGGDGSPGPAQRPRGGA